MKRSRNTSLVTLLLTFGQLGAIYSAQSAETGVARKVDLRTRALNRTAKAIEAGSKLAGITKDVVGEKFKGAISRIQEKIVTDPSSFIAVMLSMPKSIHQSILVTVAESIHMNPELQIKFQEILGVKLFSDRSSPLDKDQIIAALRKKIAEAGK